MIEIVNYLESAIAATRLILSGRYTFNKEINKFLLIISKVAKMAHAKIVAQ